MTSRRTLATATAAAAAFAAIRPTRAVATEGTGTLPPPAFGGKERIAFLIYPGFAALDVFGPHNMLAGLMPARLDLVAARRDPVLTDTNVPVLPTATFDELEPGLDVLCVPGGTDGTLAAMEDLATLAFLRRQGEAARWVSSVCTGSLVLGAAGLLRGHKATSHWLVRDLLPSLGAEPVDARVVWDRNRVTGAGVTAGMDLGLALMQRLHDDDYASAVQLVSEYDPHPPLDSGTPAKAAPAVLSRMQELFAPFRAKAEAAAREAAGSL